MYSLLLHPLLFFFLFFHPPFSVSNRKKDRCNGALKVDMMGVGMMWRRRAENGVMGCRNDEDMSGF